MRKQPLLSVLSALALMSGLACITPTRASADPFVMDKGYTALTFSWQRAHAGRK